MPNDQETFYKLKESNPAKYWQYMYQAERRKHYNMHHRANFNKGEDGANLHNACSTYEHDCVQAPNEPKTLLQVFSGEDIVDEIGKKLAEDLEKQIKEDWKVNDKS